MNKKQQKELTKLCVECITLKEEHARLVKENRKEREEYGKHIDTGRHKRIQDVHTSYQLVSNRVLHVINNA